MEKSECILTGLWEVLHKKMILEAHVQKEKLAGYAPSEIHCIEYIGNHPDSNVTKLAAAFRMTTGGATKLTKKLVEKQLITTYKLPNNKKELYFRLTTAGQEIYEMHNQLNKEFHERDQHVFNQMTEKEITDILHFIAIYNQHLNKELQNKNIDITSGIADTL